MLIDSLYRYFQNYKYRLSNQYVFPGWESDFFAMSKSGYYVEVETKISRADFFKDFEKPKHRLFESVMAGRKFHVEKTNSWHKGDLLARVNVGKIYEGSFHGYGIPYLRSGRKNGNFGYWTNQYWNHDITWHEQKYYAPVTNIRYVDLSKQLMPHQFYFCAPIGLLKKAELPPYAGLLEYEEDGFYLTKKAAYMHKREMDLTSILLRKFYHLWEYKIPDRTKALSVDIENECYD